MTDSESGAAPVSAGSDRQTRRHAKRVRRYAEVEAMNAGVERNEDGEILGPLDLTNAEGAVWKEFRHSTKALIAGLRAARAREQRVREKLEEWLHGGGAAFPIMHAIRAILDEGGPR